METTQQNLLDTDGSVGGQHFRLRTSLTTSGKIHQKCLKSGSLNESGISAEPGYFASFLIDGIERSVVP